MERSGASGADLVLHGGRIVTLAEQQPLAEALAVRDGRVLAVGSSAEIRRLVGPGAESLDLRGGTALPGFIDSHNHLLWAGLDVVRPSLASARSIADVLRVVEQAAGERPPGEWIVCAPVWNTRQLEERRYPTRHELDRAATANPVVLPTSGHVLVANSEAMRRCGVGRHTPDPPGGIIERDPSSGEPTGVLREQPAMWLAERHLPPLGPEELGRAIRAAGERYLAAGITSVIDPALTPEEMRGYFQLWREGRLPLRVSMMLRVDTEPGLEPALRLLESWGVASGFGDPWLRLGGAKLFLDGGLSQGAALLETPYASGPLPGGIQVIEAERLRAIVAAAHRNGWQVGVHASGDRAVRLLLDVYESVHRELPVNGRRFQAIHAHLTRAEDRRRARALGVVVVPQPVVVSRATWAESVFGPERAEQLWPLRSYLDGGLVLAGSSDAPVHPYQPLRGIWSAVSRRVEGTDTVLAPEQRLSRLEALRLFTTSGAYATFEEHLKGTLEPGKLADLVVLSGDPLSCREDEIKDLEVLMTMVGGRVAYRSEDL